MPVTDTLVGRLVDGRYEVVGRVARGGMATVYEALDVRLQRRVALKVMHEVLAEDPEFVERFITEARSAARLSHPGIVAVFDQGRDGPIVYLAMEYVAGRTLREHLRGRGRLEPAEALAVVEPVLGALAAAHRSGLVHRDVKPENVLVADDGGVKVADFGLARAVDRGSTVTRGVLLGTVAYVSPEQALGQAATPRSDVYAAGILLFELLTGRPPHSGLTDYVVVRKHIEEDVPPPSSAAPGVPRLVDELVRRATAREPAHRFADAGEFAGALRRARRAIDDVPLEIEPWDAAGVSATQALAAQQAGNGTYAPLQPRTPPPPAPANPYAVPPVDLRTAVITAPGNGHASGRVAGTGQVPPGGPPAPRPGQQPVPQRRRGGRLAFLMVLLLAVGTAVGAWYLGSARYTTTPSLLTLTVAEAQARAAEDGLTATEAGTGFSETVPVGQVVATRPEPGERLLESDPIELIVSKGPERYAVPELTGKTLDEARGLLTNDETRLAVGRVDERFDDVVPAGVVVSQGTPPGEQARRDQPVDLVVSKGREPLTVPDVTGQPADQAQQTLEGAGFAVARAEAFSADVPRGQVVETDPAAGEDAFRGDTVTLTVSRGPEEVEVPEVEGKDLEEARQILEGLGFVVEVTQVLPGGPNDVLRVTPGEGSELENGATVRLWVF
jgi:serine/threonine-protein kinase